eukprot:scaffold54315_cov31-Tisochrysis_lutea.AAC.6
MADAAQDAAPSSQAMPAQVPASHGPSQAHRAIRTGLTSTPHSPRAHQHKPASTDETHASGATELCLP